MVARKPCLSRREVPAGARPVRPQGESLGLVGLREAGRRGGALAHYGQRGLALRCLYMCFLSQSLPFSSRPRHAESLERRLTKTLSSASADSRTRSAIL